MERCLRCRRPAPQCLCDLLTPVPSRVQLDIVQHPAERRHAFNTARLVGHLVEDCTVHMAWPDDGALRVSVPLAADAALLFPGEDARPPTAWDAPPSQLVVLDGTWTQVRRLWFDNPWLRTLPTVGLRPSAPSRYRIREEPAAHCLSTLEAVASVLAVWEAGEGIDAHLLRAFDAMIDRHLAAERPARARFRRRARLTVQERLEDWPRVVLVHAEEVGRTTGQPRLLQWAAVRPDTGDVFDRIVELPPGNACVRSATELPTTADGSLRALVAAWRRWRRPGDHLFAWTAAVRTVAARSGIRRDVHGLKTLLGRRGRARGRLDEVVAREGLCSATVAVRGRAARRLGDAVALARWLASDPVP